jgi:transposase
MHRHALSEREWSRLEPLLPPKSRTGRPPKDHRTIIDALLWLAKAGAPWRDLPERFGPWRTVATRFYRWTRAGLWDRILAELRRIADTAGGLEWEVPMVDGTSVRAHRCAAGGKGGGSARHWAARAAGSAASCTSAATAAAGRWRSC